ncbi:MAG: DNA polymerase I, partial [Clostridia bacterium]|nr:DNA polymerase I [Clostridia bacterium]
IDLKALMGDSSDNIPGVAGVGEKTATELIKNYNSIDYIYEHLSELDIKAGVKAKLEVGRENAFFSRWLGTICRTSPIDTDPEAYITGERDTAGVAALMTELELFKLMERLGIDPNATAKTEETVSLSGELISASEFLMKDLKKVDILLSGEGFAVSDSENFAELSLSQGISLLADATVKKRVYDAKNLYKLCKTNGAEIKNVTFDALLAGYLCNPSSNSYELERLSAEYGAKIKADSDSEAKAALILTAVSDILEKELLSSGQSSLLSNIELPLAFVLGDMELSGILIDAEALRIHGEELGERVSALEKEIHQLVGYEFNINSPKQLGVALFEKLGLPAKKKTKSGYSTNAEVLEELRDAHPAVELLLKYRTLAKLKSTYCDSLLSAVAEDGRIHSTFNQTETRTGRISSLEPNLQNIPVRTAEGRVFRKFFIAKEGYTLIDADYSQIELRVLAHMANDPVMCGAFNSGKDIHTSTAAEVFGLPLDMVTPVLRSRAKAVNFGIVYGIGAFSLAKDIGVSNREAKQYIENYLATFRGVDRFMQKTIEDAKENGFVTTVYGRRRYLPEITSSNGMMRAFGERVARNAPIQGTAADIIKIAMVNVFSRLKAEKLDARLILQVHDELIIECAEDIRDTVSALLKEEMENAAKMSVELTADVHSGDSWYEAKD